MKRDYFSSFSRRWRWASLAPVLMGLFALALASQAASAAPARPVRERIPFNNDWLFLKGDPEGAAVQLNYQALRPWFLATGSEFSTLSKPGIALGGNPGESVAFTQPGFEDSSWRKLNLPHDFGIEGPFDQAYPGETGKLPWWGTAWYRKHFAVPASDKGRQLYLDIDGAMSYAAVWINGQFVGGWPYGYASWRVDLTPFVKPGAVNVLAIRLDNPPNSSRWYPGGGIYRNVWLVKTEPVHVAQWGVAVTTPEISGTAAKVNLQVTLDNHSGADAEVLVRSFIYESDARGHAAGAPVARTRPVRLNLTGSSATVDLTTTVPNPHLWYLDRPSRYVALTTVAQNGRLVDSYEAPFGIRTVKFSPDHGLLINGERITINGVCLHHDLGALGTAINETAILRQLTLLREMGCNAIRTSHNPPAPELLDLCDRMGFVVMDEAFDCWLKAKKKNDYHLLFADWHEQDLRAMLRRDRNHPCIVLWSIGNEIPEQSKPEGISLAKELISIVRSEDPTRPITSACNHVDAGYNGFQKQLDVFGYNYKPQEYGKFRAANPNQPLLGSETASCISSRGEYFFPVSDDKNQGRADFQVSSYCLSAPPWATTPDTEFQGQDQHPFVAGEFVWSGFDYLGEPTPYNSDASNLLNFTDPRDKETMAAELQRLGKIPVPSRSSYFGILDLAGFKKDVYYLYQARWNAELPMVHIVPHWTWPERVGKVTPIFVFTSGDGAELFLNGKSMGVKYRGPYDYRLRWDDIVYQPGEIKVVAYKHGLPWAKETLHTASAPAKIVLQPEEKEIPGDENKLLYVDVSVTDAAGNLAPRAQTPIHFEVNGPATIVATDNGDPTSFEFFQAPDRKAFNGRCLVILRSTGWPGLITVKASANGLQAGVAKVPAKWQR